MITLFKKSIPIIITSLIITIIECCYIAFKSPAIFSSKKVYSSLSYNDFSHLLFNNELYYFLIIFIVSHLILAAITVYFSKTINRNIPNINKHTSLLISIFLFFSLFLIMNSIAFPNSIFSTKIIAEYKSLASTLLVIFIVVIIIYQIRNTPFKISKIYIVLPIVLTLVSILYYLPTNTSTHSSNKKNIIIFSIDSLRPDTLNINKPNNSPAPFFSQKISNSHYFSNAYTPLARTFPSIMSSITGLYPKNHKAEFNLSNPDYFSDTVTLPQILKRQGYHTIHATDEKRFANFTHKQGFNELLGPPDGIFDFLLGKFSDIPVLNLLTLLPFSEHFLPHSSINRPAIYSYSPSKFTNYLSRALSNSINQHTNKPMFIFIHLCLPHFPYSWMNSITTQNLRDNYNRAISAADRQTKNLHDFLSRSGVINKNSIQIYMSDHGESLHGEITNFSLPDGSNKIIGKPGHGTDIRDIKQNHIVLAFQHTNLKSFNDPTLAATIDVTPTLLSLLNIPKLASFDGINLFNTTETTTKREITLETGFNIQAILQKKINNSEVFKQGAYAYKISKLGKVMLKKDVFKELIKKKQYGSWDGRILTVMEQGNIVRYDWANKKITYSFF